MSASFIDVSTAVRTVRADNARVNAFVNVRLDEAIEDARLRSEESPRSALHGVPYALKDEWDTVCLPTTGGSYRHRHRRPEKNCRVFDAFDEAGAVLVGKSNLSDMGLAPEAANYICGPTRNPLDPTRSAGGSSGGAAAAVAAGMVGFDWGTDIGGSIRLPAAFCGVLGLKLSSQTWPVTDLFPQVPRVLEWMCAQGPLAKTTDQIRTILDVAQPRLQTGVADESSPTDAFVPSGARVLAPDHAGQWPTFVADVMPHLQRAIDGPVTTTHRLPGTAECAGIYSGVWASHLEELTEADESVSLGSGLLAVLSSLVLRGRLGDRRFHPQCAEILALVALGRVTLYRNKARALAQAQMVRDAYGDAWSTGDIIVSPVCTYPPPKIGRTNWNIHILDCTAPGNLADATGLSIPFGRFAHLPRSIQLLGPPGSESALLDIGDRFIASRDSAA